MSSVTIAIAGLGNRGRRNYAKYALESGIKISAAADPEPERLSEAAETFGIPEEFCFGNAEELLCCEKLADALLVCTPDENHFDTSVKALKKGYHLLLEKPVATREEECLEIARIAKEEKRHVMVCHVLRYSPFYGRIKEIIDSGIIGEIATVNAVENVGYYHQAHSFVRGNWRNSLESCPMILAKCCHDFDILLWLMGGRIKTVSSYGGLYYFKPEKAPVGAALRCLDGCKAKDSCPYDAEKIYGGDNWFTGVLANPVTDEKVREALETGPYGRCVFHCDNDVADHQVVNFEFENGMTAHLTMSAFSPEIYRTIQIMGTLGMIEGDMRTGIVKTHIFGKTVSENDTMAEGENKGHGGGDTRLFKAFIELLEGKSSSALTSIDNSIDSHLACFAAERSRLNEGKPCQLKIDN